MVLTGRQTEALFKHLEDVHENDELEFKAAKGGLPHSFYSSNVDTSVANVDTSVANVDTSDANVDSFCANVDTSNIKIIPRLLGDGILEREFPLTPNHPSQRYKKSNG